MAKVLESNGTLLFPTLAQMDQMDHLGLGGLVAIGGDLSPERLLLAYELGIFPWTSTDVPLLEGRRPLLWWSPDPRAVLELEDLHVSRSMRRRLRLAARGEQGLRLSYDEAFPEVIRACGRERSEGTWILPEVEQAYLHLHELGHAHSFEVWRHERLIGGLYGVHRGGLFAAESMFHRETDASKVALIVSVRALFAAGIQLFDVQFLTSHLCSLGAREISRRSYVNRVAQARHSQPVSLQSLEVAANRY